MKIDPWNLEQDGLDPVTSIMPWDVVLQVGQDDATLSVPQVVLRCEDKPHSWGEGPNCLYLAPRATTEFEGDKLLKCEEAIAWHRRDWNMWGVETFATAYTKHKHDETSWRASSGAYLTRNGVRFLRVYHGDVAMACALALSKLDAAAEHPLSPMQFDWQKEAIGRKVWYHGEPAVIDRFSDYDGDTRVFVKPDAFDRFRPPPGWQQSGDEHEPCTPETWNDDYAEGLYVDFLSPDVDWSR